MQVLVEYRDRNQGRKRTRKWDAEGQGRAKTAQGRGQNHFWEQYRERLLDTSPSSMTHFDERGAPLAPLNFSVSISGEQRHFPGGRHGLFDYGKLSQAHVLKLGRSGTGLIALALSPFVRKCAATGHPRAVLLLCKDVLSAFAPTTVTVAALDGLSPRCARSACAALMCQTRRSLWTLTTPTALATALNAVSVVVAELRAEDVLREFSQGRFAPGWRVWSVGEDLLKEFDFPPSFPQHELSVNSYGNYYPIPTYYYTPGCAGVNCQIILALPCHLSSPSIIPSDASPRRCCHVSDPSASSSQATSLEIYEKMTKKNVLAHPLMAPVADLQLTHRHPPHSSPTVQAIYYVFSSAKAIFAGASVLLLVVITLDHPYVDCPDAKRTQVAKDVTASQDALVDIFERIESFFRWLEKYTEVPTTEEAMRGSQSDANGNFVDALQAPSRSQLGNLPLLPWLSAVYVLESARVSNVWLSEGLDKEGEREEVAVESSPVRGPKS
ncbi:hypothetical protein EDB84DRAFT_1444840 [Lactarius hengduanensis]|nr:hypothetical protein EDB84DRAFT_1444840 [Lactarius hengduanensis]